MTLTAGSKGKLVAVLAFVLAAGSCGPSTSLPEQNGTSTPGRDPSRPGGPVLPRDMSDASTGNSPPPDATGAGPVADAPDGGLDGSGAKSPADGSADASAADSGGLPEGDAHVGVCPGSQQLAGDIPNFDRSTPVGPVPGSMTLTLQISFPLRNEAALDAVVSSGNYLTPAQFTAMFGPTEADYEAVISYVQSEGFAVTNTTSNRLLLDFTGSVTDAERAFCVTLQDYLRPDGTMFYAPDREP
jgi:hypothetical protein